MAICTWCDQEMNTATSCTVDALHRLGERIAMIPFGSERPSPPGHRCGDCGVRRGGWHHLGCDLQDCGRCGRQMMSCGCHFDEDDASGCDCNGDGLPQPTGVDANGCPTASVWVDDVEVVLHYTPPIPDSDITMLPGGIRCTTALRTVIDIAADTEPMLFRETVLDFLDRSLFTTDEARVRLAQPDMAVHPGAAILRQVLDQLPPHPVR